MMVNRALIPPKHQFLRLLIRPAISELRVVSWRGGRLLGTAAAREESVPGASKKKVSKEERKAMVKEYVNKYRAMNGGKFPSASVIQKDIGGGYYHLRAILQELEFKSATVETEENPIADKVSVISPLASKELDETSEAGEVLNSGVRLGTTKVKKKTTIASTSSRISADNGSSCEGESSNIMDERVIDNKSMVPRLIELSVEDENSGITGIYEFNFREVIGSEVQVVTTSASNDAEILVDDIQGEVSSGSSHMMVDTTISNSYSEVSAKDVSSEVGETDTDSEISEVIEVLDSEVQVGTSNVSKDVDILADGGTNSLGEAIDDSGQMTVDASISNNYVEVAGKHESSGMGQIAKANGSSEVTEVLDSEKKEGTTIVSNNGDILAADNSGSKEEGNDKSSRTMVDTSNSTKYTKVCAKDAKDGTGLVGQTDNLDGISKEDSKFGSKPGYYPSEAPGAPRSTDLGKNEETSPQASESDQLTREKNQNEAQKTSIWGNLKSFASNIISIWRK